MTSVVAKMADAVSGASSKLNGHANGAPSSYAAKYNLASHFIGGSELSKAPPSKVKDFVAASDGHTVISSVSCQFPWARKTFSPPLRSIQRRI
jgi:hypothetical protein